MPKNIFKNSKKNKFDRESIIAASIFIVGAIAVLTISIVLGNFFLMIPFAILFSAGIAFMGLGLKDTLKKKIKSDKKQTNLTSNSINKQQSTRKVVLEKRNSKESITALKENL